MAGPDKKEMWIDWTHDAAVHYSPPDETEDNAELADDLIEFTTLYADGMLEEFNERFGGGAPRTSKRRKKRAEPEED
jgi:hypothetical protein